MTKLTTWQATIQDDDTGAAIVSPVITVRLGGPAGAIADLFNISGAPISNPVTGGTDGFVQFQMRPGRYWVQAADGGTFSEAWYVDAMPDEGLNWDTRAELVSDWAAGMNLVDGTVISAGGVKFEVDSTASGITDLVGVKHFGDVHVRHFGLNATPGTTDMSAIIAAADTYVFGLGGGSLHFDKEDYLATEPLARSANVRWVGKGPMGFVNPTSLAGGKADFLSMIGTRILASSGVNWATKRGVVETINTGTQLTMDAGMENIFVDANEYADHAIVCRGLAGGEYRNVGAGYATLADWPFGPEDGGDTLPATMTQLYNCFCVSTGRVVGGSGASYVGGWLFWGDARKLADDGIDVFSNANFIQMFGCNARVSNGHAYIFEDCDKIELFGCSGPVIVHSVNTMTYSTQSSNAANNYAARHIEMWGHQGSFTAKAATDATNRACSSIIFQGSPGNSVTNDIETPASSTYAYPRVQVLMTGNDASLSEQSGGWYGQEPVTALVNLSAVVPVPTGTSATVIDWSNTQWDTALDLVDTGGANPSRMTVPDGVHWVDLSAMITFDTGSNNGYRQAKIVKNGVAFIGGAFDKCLASAGGTEPLMLNSPKLKVVPGDYFEVEVLHTDGADLNVLSGVNSWFSMTCY